MVMVAAGNPISLDAISNEFGGARPDSLSEYYGADPYGYPTTSSISAVPSSGPLSLSNFYSTSARTAKITLGYAVRITGDTPTSNETRIGWSASGKTNYWHFENSTITNAMGSITRTTGLITSGTLYHFQVTSAYAGGTIEIASSRNSDGGWTRCYVYIPSYSTSIEWVMHRANADGWAHVNASRAAGAHNPGNPGISGVYKYIFAQTSGGGTFSSHTGSYISSQSSVSGGYAQVSGLVTQIKNAYLGNHPIYIRFD